MNELKKKKKKKKIPTAQLVEELSNREDIDSYTTTESYGVLHKAKNVDKRYPVGTVVLFVNPQGGVLSDVFNIISVKIIKNNNCIIIGIFFQDNQALQICKHSQENYCR